MRALRAQLASVLEHNFHTMRHSRVGIRRLIDGIIGMHVGELEQAPNRRTHDCFGRKVSETQMALEQGNGHAVLQRKACLHLVFRFVIHKIAFVARTDQRIDPDHLTGVETVLTLKVQYAIQD